MNPHRSTVGVVCNLPSVLILCLLLVIPNTAFATPTAPLDTNANGMSDVFERHYNQGELFNPADPGHHPDADPDGDGWSNLHESIAGTDPFSGKPPEGLVVCHMTYLANQEEAPNPEFPNGRLIDLAILSWDSLPGKQYTLLFSSNLEAGSWTAVDTPHTGEGYPIAVPVILTDIEGHSPDRLIWRVRINDQDSDSDGLTDHEEILLGLNPYQKHTIGIGIPDSWLATYLGHIPGIFQDLDPYMILPGSDGSILEAWLSLADPTQPFGDQLPIWTVANSGETDSSDPPDPPVVRTRTVTLPAGSSALVLVAIASREFDEWTDPEETSNEYNDILTWNLGLSHGSALSGEVNINDRHQHWLDARDAGQTLSGLMNTVHYEHIDTLQAPHHEPLEIEITLSAVNVSDNYLASEIVVGILPIEMKVVDRDDPTRKWGDENEHISSMPIFAGESSGDMLSWRLAGTDNWTNVEFTWTAEGPGGEIVTGPTDAGKNEWTIHNNDDDAATNWLKWKPGKWTINVQIGSAKARFEQEIGWRTEDFAVIGQVVETEAHDNDAPPLIAVGDNFWDIYSPVALYRRAVLYDMLDLPIFDEITNPARDALMVTPLPITAKLTEIWFGYWYLMPSLLTPKGPFTESYPSEHGNVEYGHRLWALQHVFNVSPDAPHVPQTFSNATFDTIRAEEQYRLIHRYKSKFQVTSEGKIDSDKVVMIQHVAETGPTKMNFGIAAGEFLPIWNNPAYTFFSLPTQPSETNSYQGAHSVSGDGTKLSYYATGRVGAGGQNVNWRLIGKDAPWIFSEIIVELKPDRTVAELFKTSVDVSWSESNGRQGEAPFNNMNVYKGVVGQLQDGSFTVTFTRKDLMPMEGQMEAFINSASGQRPEPPIPPSIQ